MLYHLLLLAMAARRYCYVYDVSDVLDILNTKQRTGKEGVRYLNFNLKHSQHFVDVE